MAQRPQCNHCQRPLVACLCSLLPNAEFRQQPWAIELLILQHPLEVNNAKGSAKLLQLALPSSRLLIGEQFEPTDLNAHLYQGQRYPLLLYPEAAATAALAQPDQDILAQPERIRLVLLDGTWRKSLKMLHLNAPLQRLPRWSISSATSNYRIRKAPRQGQLSTLEAACYALMQLEPNPDRYQPLLDSFDAFIAQRLAFINPR